MYVFHLQSTSPYLLLRRAFIPSSDRLGPKGVDRSPVFSFSPYPCIMAPKAIPFGGLETALSVLLGTPVFQYAPTQSRNRVHHSHTDIDENHPLIIVYRDAERELGLGNVTLVERFSLYPMPTEPYDDIVNRFLAQRFPKTDIVIARRDMQAVDAPDIVHEPLSEGKCLRVPGLDSALRVERVVSLSYRTVLELLWLHPDTENIVRWSESRFGLDDLVLIVRMTSEDWFTSHVVFDFRERTRDGSGARIYLFTDTLAILPAFLGYYRMPANQTALLILTWWNLALSNMAFFIDTKHAVNTSLLMVSDILRRLDRLELINGMLRSHAQGSELQEFAFEADGYRIPFRVVRPKMMFRQSELIQVWNLVRTQLGLPPVDETSYLTVTQGVGNG